MDAAAAAAAARAVRAMLIEVRTEYVAGTLIFIARWFARWKVVGFRNWWWDDFFSVMAWVWYTFMYSMAEYLVVMGAAAAMSQEQREMLPPAMRESMRKGGISMFASFYILILLTWSLKGTLICFFLRLTSSHKMQRYVYVVAGISVAAFIAAMLTQTLHCLPIHKNWQVLPDPGMECSAGINTNIVVAVGNVFTDLLLLAVPVLFLKDSQITLWRKAKIGFLLSLGGFVIAFSLLRCILTVSDPTTVNSSSLWAEREAIVAIFAVNTPVLNPLFRRSTWTGTKTNKTGGSSRGYTEQHDQSGMSSRLERRKSTDKYQIYKMTDIETSSKESTSELVNADNPSPWTSIGPKQTKTNNRVSMV